MYNNIVAILLVLICLNIPCHSWRSENFFVNSKLPLKCGRTSNYLPDIRYASWGNWPWLGLLSYEGFDTTKCIAVLIHPEVVMTGSLCIRNIQSHFDETLTVEFSSPGLPSYQNLTITQVDFSSSNPNANSLALLKLKHPVKLSAVVQPLCLWEENLNYTAQLDSQTGLSIGSDLVSIESVNSLRILQTTVRVVGQSQCEVYFGRMLRNTICITYVKDTQSCHQIGSLLMFPRLSDDGTIVWYLRGLLTQRMRICGGNIISPLYDLANQRQWIETHFKPTVESSCGRRAVSFTPLVTLGYEAVRGDFPWHIAMYLYSQDKKQISYRCGASLISQIFAITAGHCVVKSSSTYPVDRFSLALGKHDLQSKETGALVAKLSMIILHEKYGYETLQNDIALLKLDKAVTFNDYIQPICMWDETNIKKSDVFNMNGKVPGWGMNENDELSRYLSVASVPIVDDYYCLQSHETFYHRYLTNTTFCAGNPRGNATSVCNGDSGGGLVLSMTQGDRSTSWYLRGVVSVSIPKPGKRICDPDYYAVFTDVAQYIKWINKKIMENS